MGLLLKYTMHLLWLTVLLAGVFGVVSTTTALEVGEQAPDFTLPSTAGEQISLSQFRGKKLVLIEFHVSDFGVT
jgi:peroxiredoxin